jgi:Protein of unknown function (DUF2971)
LSEADLWTRCYLDMLPFPEDRYVYHYTKWDVARDHILGGERTIQISSAQKMNDPLESQGFANRLSYRTDTEFSEDFMQRVYPIIQDSCRTKIHIFATSKDRNPTQHDHPNGRITSQEGCRGFGHPPMWAHYGENHAGVCLLLDRLKIDRQIVHYCQDKIIRSSCVSYLQMVGSTMARLGVDLDPDWQTLNDSELSSKVLGFLNDLDTPPFLMKHSDWSYENEYRWVILGGDTEKLTVPLQGDEIVGVLAGSRFEEDNRNELSEICKKAGISGRQLSWTEGQANRTFSLEKQ